MAAEQAELATTKEAAAALDAAGGAAKIAVTTAHADLATASEATAAALADQADKIREDARYPRNLFGKLVGVGGGKIKAVRTETKADVFIKQGDDYIEVQIEGAAEQVQAAKSYDRSRCAGSAWHWESTGYV